MSMVFDFSYVYYSVLFTCNAGDLSSFPGLGRSPGEGNDYPVQYSCLENPKDGGAWWAAVYGVAQSQTWLMWLSSSSSSRVLLISVIVFSLNVYSLILLGLCLLILAFSSVCFQGFLIIFTIIILNSFSGSLPISSSFIWTSVFLVCSFICVVFLCLFIIFF